jgi:hypothetical protein
MILDQCDQFSKNKFPNLLSMYEGKYYGYSVSELFLMFAENFFTTGKADPNHRPSIKSCLIRFPETINLKNNESVKIIQRLDGKRPAIQWITTDFKLYLIQKRIDDINEKNKMYSLTKSNINKIYKLMK